MLRIRAPRIALSRTSRPAARAETTHRLVRAVRAAAAGTLAISAVITLAPIGVATAQTEHSPGLRSTSWAQLQRDYDKLTPPLASLERLVAVDLAAEGPVPGGSFGRTSLRTMSTWYCTAEGADACIMREVFTVKIWGTTRFKDVTASVRFDDATMTLVNGVRVYSAPLMPRSVLVRAGKVIVEVEVAKSHLNTISAEQAVAIAKVHQKRA